MIPEVFERYREMSTAVAAAAADCGRDPATVRLLPVSKTVGAAVIRELYDCGLWEFGENRIAVLSAKAAELPPDIVWHFIGPLQSNKVRKAVRLAAVIHSVDNPELLERIDRIAAEEHRTPRLLFEVNISGEASKGGCTPAAAAELVRLAAVCRHVIPTGLMTMAPLDAAPDEQLKIFSGLRELRDRLSVEANLELPELSMGMSRDFPAAIAAGATIVRIGSNIFQ